MEDAFVPLLALFFFILGAVLLSDGQSESSISQTARVLAGASFIALGLISTSLAMKNWWKWRKTLREQRRN